MGYWGSRSSRRGGGGWGGFGPYVPVAERRAKAAKELVKLQKKTGAVHQPVRLEGKQIARTFWGKAWCENLEAYSDFENRLPRGRTYVRNGSVLHLDIRQGMIEALVSGSSLYTIKIGIKPVAAAQWETLRKECAGSIGSLMELLSGKLSERVMSVMTNREKGLFPKPSEITLNCSCPDWADMCKHVAAVLYGVGARLDLKPELLFLLRHADHQELISQSGAVEALTSGKGAEGEMVLAGTEIGNVFGIELTEVTPPASSVKSSAKVAVKPKRSKAKAVKSTGGKGKDIKAKKTDKSKSKLASSSLKVPLSIRKKAGRDKLVQHA